MKKNSSLCVVQRAVVLVFVILCSSCKDSVPIPIPSADERPNQVGVASGRLLGVPSVDVADQNRFLNDLMLSPMWKVEKNIEGDYVARPRSLNPEWTSSGQSGQFLFEDNAGAALREGNAIENSKLRGEGDYCYCYVSIVFNRPDADAVAIADPENDVLLPIQDYRDAKIGPNSFSEVAIKLSSRHEIYIICREQGDDPIRNTTFRILPLLLQEIARVDASPEEYRVEDRYATLFERLFDKPLVDQQLGRFPGIQECDTFYGCLRTRSDTNYDGVSIKISHPIYCPDEGTRKSARLRKAEYLGKPYYEDDLLFFLIEHNAVYLPEQYDERFGWFSGTESFDGELQLLNDEGTVLLQSTEPFRGWER